jgi:hypothetical protein
MPRITLKTRLLKGHMKTLLISIVSMKKRLLQNLKTSIPFRPNYGHQMLDDINRFSQSLPTITLGIILTMK